MTNTTTRSAWDLPVYANKPRRTIPGTTAVAVTMYRSGDGTVAEYAVFSADGMASLGTAHLQIKRRFRTRGYTMVAVERHDSEKWPSLTAFAIEMAKRLNVEGVAK